MKKRSLTSVLLLAALAWLSAASAEGLAIPERDSLPIDQGSTPPERLRLINQRGGFERNYEKQPPLVPHQVEKEQIDLKTNTCLKCHSDKNYQEAKAPKLGDSHFLDRDGKKLDQVSGRRWFCTQCHVPQEDATPLVENTFKSGATR